MKVTLNGMEMVKVRALTVVGKPDGTIAQAGEVYELPSIHASKGFTAGLIEPVSIYEAQAEENVADSPEKEDEKQNPDVE